MEIKQEHAEGVLAEINPNLESGSSNLSWLSSPPLKRKRTQKLDIPKSHKELRMVGLHEKTFKEECIDFEGDHHGFYCKKGNKEIMEDTYKVTTNIDGDDQQVNLLLKVSKKDFQEFLRHGTMLLYKDVLEKKGQLRILPIMSRVGSSSGDPLPQGSEKETPPLDLLVAAVDDAWAQLARAETALKSKEDWIINQFFDVEAGVSLSEFCGEEDGIRILDIESRDMHKALRDKVLKRKNNM